MAAEPRSSDPAASRESYELGQVPGQDIPQISLQQESPRPGGAPQANSSAAPEASPPDGLAEQPRRSREGARASVSETEARFVSRDGSVGGPHPHNETKVE